jgi:hypothetical protein
MAGEGAVQTSRHVWPTSWEVRDERMRAETCTAPKSITRTERRRQSKAHPVPLRSIAYLSSCGNAVYKPKTHLDLLTSWPVVFR